MDGCEFMRDFFGRFCRARILRYHTNRVIERRHQQITVALYCYFTVLTHFPPRRGFDGWLLVVKIWLT